ncbi:MAG TPA: AAA family ATPase [Candidatus Limnocylindrales bacterium]|nr:AAA family ATPase [Candidatus Limnocylindrales bacterium]
MIHLREVRLALPPDRRSFPFDLPAIRGVRSLRFETPVTLFVGENGSGKSTVLEALAIASKAITAGSVDAADDPSLEGVRALARSMTLTWATRTHRGFFLRAEDFFGYARRMGQLRAELAADLAAVDAEYSDREGSLAHELARTPYLRELADLERRYGDGLDSQSHGESFLRFFGGRLVPGGTYFLDEPEAPLSPARQLAFLALLKELVEADGQAVIATHSPILLAFPGAAIWSFDAEGGIAPVGYEDLEHVRLTRDFLANPEAFLRHL